MNKSETVMVLATISEYWPNWRQPADAIQADLRVRAWQDMLDDLPIVAVTAAIKAIAIEPNRQFAPAPGEVRLMAFRLINPDGGVPSPEEAWAEVLGKISRVGYTNSLNLCGPECSGRECDHHDVLWSHPVVASAVNGLGWEYLCRSDNQMADRAHFMKFYATAVETQQRRAALPTSVLALMEGVAGVPGLGPVGPLEVEA